MQVEVNGTIRLLSEEGIWLLRRKKWREASFTQVFDTNTDADGSYKEVAQYFKVAVLIEKEMVVVKARLRGVHFVLGECKIDGERHINLSVQSVAKAEVRGDLYFRQTTSKPFG